MNAREVLAGLRAAEQGCYPRWHDGQSLCPLCKDDGSCALAAAIQWFEDHIGAEDIRARTDASLAPVTKAIDEAVANAERLLFRSATWEEGTVVYVDGAPHRLTRTKSGDGLTTELQFVKVKI